MENTTIKEILEELKQKNEIRNNINKKISAYGYENIEPSFFEKYDAFNQFHGRIKKEKTVKVINNKGEIEILRPDITLNIIKNVSRIWATENQIKLCYDSTVFSNDQSLGIVETRQIGAERLGDQSIDCDIEILNITKEILDTLDKTILVIGNTKYLKGLLNEIKASDDLREKVNNAIYKKDLNELKDTLMSLEIKAEVKAKFLMLITEESFDKEKFYEGFLNREMTEALSEIETISRKLNRSKNVILSYDLGLVSEYDYYDGIIFKGFHAQINKAFIKGGRYDKLSSLFNKAIPAVGFSMALNEYIKVYGGSND